MATSIKIFFYAIAALLVASFASFGQQATSTPPAVSPTGEAAHALPPNGVPPRNSELAPMTLVQAAPVTTSTATPAAATTAEVSTVASHGVTMTPAPAAAQPTTATAGATTSTENTSVTENGGPGVHEFQGEEVGEVLRLLAQQAHINMVVSDKAADPNSKVTVRLEDVTTLEAINIIVKAKGLSMR
ncbi:MAG: hypothetical protein ACREFG_05135, partial [Chthoniobacterales bacterium]